MEEPIQSPCPKSSLVNSNKSSSKTSNKAHDTKPPSVQKSFLIALSGTKETFKSYNQKLPNSPIFHSQFQALLDSSQQDPIDNLPLDSGKGYTS